MSVSAIYVILLAMCNFDKAMDKSSYAGGEKAPKVFKTKAVRPISIVQYIQCYHYVFMCRYLEVKYVYIEISKIAIVCKRLIYLKKLAVSPCPLAFMS